jgi:hypothetical protein
MTEILRPEEKPSRMRDTDLRYFKFDDEIKKEDELEESKEDDDES